MAPHRFQSAASKGKAPVRSYENPTSYNNMVSGNANPPTSSAVDHSKPYTIKELSNKLESVINAPVDDIGSSTAGGGVRIPPSTYSRAGNAGPSTKTASKVLRFTNGTSSKTGPPTTGNAASTYGTGGDAARSTANGTAGRSWADIAAPSPATPKPAIPEAIKKTTSHAADWPLIKNHTITKGVSAATAVADKAPPRIILSRADKTGGPHTAAPPVGQNELIEPTAAIEATPPAPTTTRETKPCKTEHSVLKSSQASPAAKSLAELSRSAAVDTTKSWRARSRDNPGVIGDRRPGRLYRPAPLSRDNLHRLTDIEESPHDGSQSKVDAQQKKDVAGSSVDGSNKSNDVWSKANKSTETPSSPESKISEMEALLVNHVRKSPPQELAGLDVDGGWVDESGNNRFFHSHQIIYKQKLKIMALEKKLEEQRNMLNDQVDALDAQLEIKKQELKQQRKDMKQQQERMIEKTIDDWRALVQDRDGEIRNLHNYVKELHDHQAYTDQKSQKDINNLSNQLEQLRQTMAQNATFADMSARLKKQDQRILKMTCRLLWQRPYDPAALKDDRLMKLGELYEMFWDWLLEAGNDVQRQDAACAELKRRLGEYYQQWSSGTSLAQHANHVFNQLDTAQWYNGITPWRRVPAEQASYGEPGR